MRCRGWLSLIPCRTCGSESIKGSPPFCSVCRTLRPRGDALRCETPLEVGGTLCDTCSYPVARPRVLVSTMADEEFSHESHSHEKFSHARETRVTREEATA